MLITAIINFLPLLVFSNLRARLLSFESQISHPLLSDSSVSSANPHHMAFLFSSGCEQFHRGGRTRRYDFGGHSDPLSAPHFGRGNQNQGRTTNASQVKELRFLLIIAINQTKKIHPAFSSFEFGHYSSCSWYRYLGHTKTAFFSPLFVF